MKRLGLKLLVITLLFIPLSGKAQTADEAILEELRALKARVAELETQIAQKSTESASNEDQHDHGEEDHHEHGEHSDEPAVRIGFGDHHHHEVDTHKISLHGGVDVRFEDAEDSESEAKLQGAEIGVEVKLADWMTGLAKLTKEDGEDAKVEEAYLEFVFAEINSVVRAGKYFVPFGYENQLEYFDRPTISRSPMVEEIFGEEPWIDVGGQLTYILPVFWQTESQFTVAAFNGDNEASFGDGDEDTSESNDNFPLVLNYSTYRAYDWGAFKAGLSFSHGNNDADENLETTLWGVDAQINIENFKLIGEYIYREKEEGVGSIDGDGYSIYASYAFPLDFKYLRYVEVLYGFGQADVNESTRETRHTPQITFGLAENTKFRFAYEFRDEDEMDIDNDRFLAQLAYHF